MSVKYLVAASATAALTLAPTATFAEERPYAHIALEIGGMGIFDGGGLKHTLARSGLTAPPPGSLLVGGRFGIEFHRFYFGSHIFHLQSHSETSRRQSFIGLADFGYRVLGSPTGWGIIPVIGFGAGGTSLRVGSVGDATSFSAALRARAPVELQSKSFIVHAGVIADVLRIYNPGLQNGISLGLSAGFLAAPLSSRWAATSVGSKPPGPGLAGGPHTPLTGLYGGVSLSIAF